MAQLVVSPGSAGYIVIGEERYPIYDMVVKSNLGECTTFSGRLLPGEIFGRNEVARNPEIENVIFNDPATVVMWSDGTKTVVKCQPGDTYSKETGLALCIAKKYLGNKGNFNEVFKQWIPEEIEPVEEDEDIFEEYDDSPEEDAETGAINLKRSDDILVGDKVRVVNYGQTYSSYSDWVERHVKKRTDAAKWNSGGLMRNGNIGVVKYIAPHENGYDGDLAYVEIDGKCYVINIIGLKKVEED